MSRFFWDRKSAFNTAVSSLIQRVFDWHASAIVVKTSPGQPRYYDNQGNAISALAVLAAIAEVDLGAGIQEDRSGPAFADFTTELASAAAGDVDFFPAGAGANDAFYFGLATTFDRLTITVGTAGAGTYTVPTSSWEYWNGSAWVSLAGVTDSTNGFKAAGSNTVVFTVPNNWVRTTINSQGPFFYVRASRDGGTVTTDPAGDIASARPAGSPDEFRAATFFGAHFAGKIAVQWLATTPADTVSFEVWARTDSVVTVEGDPRPDMFDDLVFDGSYVLVYTASTIADRAEVLVDVGYRPVYIRPTSVKPGTLRMGPA